MYKFHFRKYGLGDYLHLCFYLKLYQKYAIPFQFDPEPAYRFLVEACNIPTCDDAKIKHPWNGPAPLGRPFVGQDWWGNIMGLNLQHPHPLPKLETPINALWPELLDIRLDIRDKINLPEEQPYVLTHTRGTSNPRNKDIAEHELELWQTLNYNHVRVVHLDRNNELAYKHPLFRQEKTNSVEKLISLVYGAKGMIGVDSGPCILTRLNYDLPTLQVWTKHSPCHYVLPRPALHALTDRHNPTHKWNEVKKESFQIDILEALSGGVIAGKMISLLNLVSSSGL
jgi:hypothetical protein